MDFHNMKRKELQALCKKHKIPANLSNLEMANKLSEYLKEKENPVIERLKKGPDEDTSETESANVVVNRNVKKVRFSPEHELIEFTRSREMKRRSRRNSALSRNSGSSVENVGSSEMNKENVGLPSRVTRSRGLNLMEGNVNEKKRGINTVKCNDKNTRASAVEIFENGRLKEGDVDSSDGVILLGGLEEGIKNVTERERKRAKYDKKRDETAVDNVDNEKLVQGIEGIVDNPGRLTRSKVQKLTEASVREEKIGRKVVKRSGNVASVRAETDNNRVASLSSFSNRGDIAEGKLARGSDEKVKTNGKRTEEVLEDKKITGEQDVIEPPIFLRRSKRNANRIGESEISNDDTKKHENDEIKSLRRTSRLLGAESTGNEINQGRTVALKVEEPNKVEPRRSNRRKNVIESDELKAENEKRYPLRSTVPKLGITGEVSKDDEQVPQPTGVLRRSRRKTLSVMPCLAEKECSAVQKNTRRSRRDTSKCKSPGLPDEIGGVSVVHKKNELMKRKSGLISGDVTETNNDPSSVAQTMKESSSKKALPAAATGLESAAGSSDTKLINGKEFMNSDTNAASRITELKTDLTDFEDRISSSNIRSVKKGHSSLEFDVQELIEQNIADTDKNDRETEVFSQRKDSGSDNKTDNQVLPESSNVSGKEGFAESSSADSIFLCVQTDTKTDPEVAEAEADKCLQPSPNTVDHVGEVKGISVQENLDTDENRQDTQVLPEGSNVSGKEGFAETGSSADSLLLGDETDIKTDLEVAEAEADKRLHPNSCVVDHVGEVNGISVQENLGSDETRQDNQLLPEGSNASGKEANLDEAKANKLIQPSPSVVDRIDEVKEISVEENLDSDETRQENQLLPEGPNASAKEANLEVVEAEANRPIQPSPSVVDHIDEVKEISVEENLDSGEIRYHIDADHLEAANSILDNSNEDAEDASPKAGEVGAFESCKRQTDCTYSKTAIELKAPSSGTLTRLEGGNMAEGNETFFHKGINSALAETNGDGRSNNQESAFNQYSECGVPDLSDSERSARTVPQDKGISLGDSIMNSNEQGMYKDSLAINPMAISTQSIETNLKEAHEVDHTLKREEIYNDKSINSDGSGDVEGGSSKVHKSKCDGDREFSVPVLSDAEGRPGITEHDNEIFSGEYSIKDFDEQGIICGSPLVASTNKYNCTRDQEGNLTARGDEGYIYNYKQSDLIEADESGCLNSHRSSKDEDWEFNISKLFDGEKSARITPQDRGIVSAKYSIEDLNEKLMFSDPPALSATCENYNEVKFSADISNLEESCPSKTSSVSVPQADQPKSPWAEPTALANTIQMQEACSNASEMAGNAMCLLTINAKRKISQVVEDSSTDEDATDANCDRDKKDFSGTCITDVKISTDCTMSKIGVECHSDMKFLDSEESDLQNKNLLARQTEAVAGEGPNDVVSRQSWTGTELHNLFGTTWDDNTPSGLDDTSLQGTELANPRMSSNKSIASICGSLSQMKEKEIEGERSSECTETTNKDMVLPSSYEEVSHTRSNLDGEVNQLKLLFASPIKIAASCEIDETYSHDRKPDTAVKPIIECFDTKKENSPAQIKSDEKVRDARYELENSLCLGDPLSDNGKDVTFEELNEVESPEAEYDGCEASKEQLAENMGDECLKETNLITEEDKEEIVVPLGQSCLYDEATDNDCESTQKNIISLSASPRNLGNFEGFQGMLIDTNLLKSLSRESRDCHKSEGKMTQSSEAAFELSDADLQKSNVPENSDHLIARSKDDKILKDTPTETFSSPLDAVPAEISSFDGQKDVIDKGSSPHLSPKASPDYDEVKERRDSIRESDDPHEAKIWSNADGIAKSFQDISCATHTNCEVAILKSISTGYNMCPEVDNLRSFLDLEGACKEAKETCKTTQDLDNIVAAAEHGSSVYGAVSGTLSSPAMHLHIEDNENGGAEKLEARTPVFSLEGDHEKQNGTEAEENSTNNTVQFTIQELHFEERAEEFNNHIQTVSHVHASACNEILKESDVADTIKEYIDSESSLSVIFENSSPLSIDALANTDERSASENAASCNYEEDIAGRLANTEGEDDVPLVGCVETVSKEPEEAKLFMEPAPASGKAVNSPACVDFVAEGSTVTEPLVEVKGSAVKIDSEKETESGDGHRSCSKQLRSTAKKNARTILIHGTPGKHLNVADMKENAPTSKSTNVGDFTAVRPAKRRALQDVQWK